MSKVECPIWGTPASLESTDRDGILVNSPRAGGRYFISGTALVAAKWDDKRRVAVTNWLVRQREQGTKTPEITSYVLENIRPDRMPEAYQRADALLKWLNSRTSFLGEDLQIPDNDPLVFESLAFSGSLRGDELIFLLKYLQLRSFISFGIHSSGFYATIQMAGFDRLRELSETTTISSQGFVAMWFDPSLEEAFVEGIAPAIESAGYTPFRIDRKDHNNKIDDEIIAEIRRSRFVVADFTQSESSGARGGVYYEAGFAHGLNIPVIFLCRQDALSRVHFDTRQYNHIVWDTPELLRDRLSKRISATIGDGPSR